MKISIKTEKEIEKMRVAGKLAAEVLEMIEPFVVPGVSTEELDNIAMSILLMFKKQFLQMLVTAVLKKLFVQALIK